MLNGIILKKLQTMEVMLSELRSLGMLNAANLETDWRTRRAVERNLQVAVEAMMDICQRILSLRGYTPAATGSESIQRCVKLGALSAEEPYRRMVQFRNFIVHRYDQVDAAILVEIVNRRLDDFERFIREIRSYAAAG